MFLDKSVNELDLSLRSYRAVTAAGFKKVRDIDVTELANRPGVGPKLIEEVEEKLEAGYWFVYDIICFYK